MCDYDEESTFYTGMFKPVEAFAALPQHELARICASMYNQPHNREQNGLMRRYFDDAFSRAKPLPAWVHESILGDADLSHQILMHVLRAEGLNAAATCKLWASAWATVSKLRFSEWVLFNSELCVCLPRQIKCNAPEPRTYVVGRNPNASTCTVSTGADVKIQMPIGIPRRQTISREHLLVRVEPHPDGGSHLVVRNLSKTREAYLMPNCAVDRVSLADDTRAMQGDTISLGADCKFEVRLMPPGGARPASRRTWRVAFKPGYYAGVKINSYMQGWCNSAGQPEGSADAHGHYLLQPSDEDDDLAWPQEVDDDDEEEIEDEDDEELEEADEDDDEYDEEELDDPPLFQNPLPGAVQQPPQMQWSL